MSKGHDAFSLTDNSIRFGDRLASSASFKILFRDGMALVEDTAAYLDGVGREEVKGLPRAAALAYAAESMRLTTRLMQIASWLLLQRAVNEGEMTRADVMNDKRRTRSAWQQTPTADDGTHALPAALTTLIADSMRLQERIMHMDALIDTSSSNAVDMVVPHPLESQMLRLREAFCA